MIGPTHVALVLAAVACSATPPPDPPARPNVLFLVVDDLRPELGCYGVERVRSLNIDRLASRGLLFERAYCQQAVCNPSRASFLTGRRPESLGVTGFDVHFRDVVPDAVTLPQLFRAQGYATRGVGKIFHRGKRSHDDAQSWTARSEGPGGDEIDDEDDVADGPDGPKGERPAKKPKGANLSKQRPWEARAAGSGALPDEEIAEQAIAALRELKGEPFFLAVGFLKPHLPFVAPQRFYDLYDPAELPAAPDPFHPRGAPPWTVGDFDELRVYKGVPKNGPIPAELARGLVHGYYACVSYADAQVGRVLDELDALGLRESTIVVLLGDHGWQLGEHATWCKHTAYEVSTRAPLIVSVPGQRSAGRRTDALVELVDLFPTLAELCGLPPPDGLEGTSLRPLLDDPERAWKSAAFSIWPKKIPDVGPGMGRAIRTERYRLVEWTADGSDFRALELYDHASDPGEDENLAADPERAGVVRELVDRLHAGWRAALPR